MATALRGTAPPASPQQHRMHQQPTTSSSASSPAGGQTTTGTGVGGSSSSQSQQHSPHQQSQPNVQQPQPHHQPSRTFFPRKHPTKQFFNSASPHSGGGGGGSGGHQNQHQQRQSGGVAGDGAGELKQAMPKSHEKFSDEEKFGANDDNQKREFESQQQMASADSPMMMSNVGLPPRNGSNGGGGRPMPLQHSMGSHPHFEDLHPAGGSSSFSAAYGGGGGSDGGGVLSETNLYIRGLPEDCTDEKLRELCSHYGKVVSTKAILDKATKKCRGYGFVDFDCSDSAQAAIKGLTDVGGTGIHAQMAKQQEQDPTNLYIANLPPDFDEERLSELLHAHGLVISSRILRNPDGSSRGVGFCRMTTAESCASIIREFHGKRIGGDGNALPHPPLIVKLADSSSRKSKQRNSTPSMRSYYSGDSHSHHIGGGHVHHGGFGKPKMTATPLMTTPLLDPIAFQSLQNPSLAAFNHQMAALANGAGAGRYAPTGVHQYVSAATATAGGYAQIPDLLAAQFQQMGMVNGGGGGPGSDSGGQMEPQQQQTAGQQPSSADQQMLANAIAAAAAAAQQPPQQPMQLFAAAQQNYYAAAAGAMPTASYYVPQSANAAGYQPFTFLYPQDYFTLAAAQQQQQQFGVPQPASIAHHQMPSTTPNAAPGQQLFQPQSHQNVHQFVPQQFAPLGNQMQQGNGGGQSSLSGTVDLPPQIHQQPLWATVASSSSGPQQQNQMTAGDSQQQAAGQQIIAPSSHQQAPQQMVATSAPHSAGHY